VRIPIDDRFARSEPAVRVAFDRLVELASVDGPIPVIAQKTRIVLAAPMRFLAVEVRGDRLLGGSGLVMHRFEIRDAEDLDTAFAALVREAAERVGRRTRFRA
jgi:hypothetical protein